MKPPLRCLDRRWALSVLHLLDRVVDLGIDDDLFVDNGVCNVVAKAPPDSTAASGFDEACLGSRVKGILALDKLRVQHSIALLSRGRL